MRCRKYARRCGRQAARRYTFAVRRRRIQNHEVGDVARRAPAGRRRPPRAIQRQTPPTRRSHSRRHRADRLPAVRVVPSAGRRRAVQPAHLRATCGAARAQIAAVTGSRYMPPWKPEPGFGDFAGERRLSDDAIVDHRSLGEGRARSRATRRTCRRRRASAPAGSSASPIWSCTLPGTRLRADGADVFRNFVVTVPGTATRYVRGFEFRPGSRAVHHANIRVDPTPASRRLEEADPAPGYEGHDPALRRLS